MIRKFLSAVAAAALAFTLAAPAYAAPSRIYGNDRYGTSLAIAQTYFPAAEAVFVATGKNFPDALAAGPLAARQRAPMLLVGDALTNVQMNYLSGLKSPNITVLGGPSVVNRNIEAQLKHYGNVSRVYGSDRYQTAAHLALQFGAAKRLYLATGANYADALSGGALAAREGMPIMLTGLGAEQTAHAVAQQLGVTETVVFGGPAVVSNAAISAMPNARRVYGRDRYQTAAQIFSENPSGQAFLASGLNFPDALSVVPAAGISNMPLLLAQSSCSPSMPTVPVTLVGGPGVLSNNAAAKCVAPKKPAVPKKPVSPKPAVPRNPARPIGKNCPANYPIKGNGQSHIYHMPGQRFYAVTVPEKCFATQADARAAGYRKAKV
ncbi:MAG: cell wall-binding repeat-containing protein [Arcanobacterium sp.]|nr:cell wall-binding repeat-containing protein [Arcanobacterium sp.]MDY5589218.1 cell wall-binding repeat-containing protein [Arcanobacterium sp.]